MEEIKLVPIGRVSNSLEECKDEHWGEVTSRIVLNPEYEGALLGLEDFSHVIILTYLHRSHYVREKHLQRRPRNLETMPKVGIFSQRAKDRPNPIGLTAVKVVRVAKDHIEVKGLDAVNGTPVLDIKPYYPHYDKIENPKIPEWVDRLMKDYF